MFKANILIKAILIIAPIYYSSPAISQTSNPIRIGFGPGGATYVLPEDIKIEENGFSAKIISEFDRPNQHNDGRFVKSIELHYSAVCRPRLFRLNMMAPRTGPMGTGDILSAAQAAPVWRSPVPGESIAIIAGIFCKD